jgi:lipid II:glycine glycyltransferase (peptidoglycan interpeptide bridge formation enzyme)
VYEYVIEKSMIAVRPIEEARHRDFLRQRADPEHVSFMQAPAWGRVKNTWRAESLGWLAGDELLGTALVLHRDLPSVPLLGRRSFAYIPEGPTVDWFGADWFGAGRRAADWIDPLVAYLRRTKVFSIKLGPRLTGRQWSAATVRAGMADPACTGFADLPADTLYPDADRFAWDLQSMGWTRRGAAGHGIEDVQPRYFLQLPLRGRSAEEVFAGFSPQWRRNVRAAERAGVKVWQASMDELPLFHAMYAETAERDGFIPRPLEYLQRMFREILADDPDGIRLYLAGADGFASAGAVLHRFGRRPCFGYGASTTERRELRASNALHWGIVQDCLAEGMDCYDMRGVGETLDAEHAMFGLLRFKIGSGSEVVEYPGEYDFAVNRLLHTALSLYLRLTH